MNGRLKKAVTTVLCAFLLCCDRPMMLKPSQAVAEEESKAQEVHRLVNQYRASKGLSALTWNEKIASVALQHSRNMASGATPFGHDGFESRLEEIAKFIPWKGAAENVAFNQGAENPAQAAVNSWLNSPGHKADIEGDYSQTGIGIARTASGGFYFTQIFVKPK